MLTGIKSLDAKPAEEDAIALLLGCHQRIRHFTGVALRLAENPQAGETERADAARAVLRYYTIALPLHEADENDSIYPRLRKKLPEGALAEANETMVAQHQTIDTLVAALVPQWQTIVDRPAGQNAFRSLLQQTHQLQNTWTSHLQMEEEQVVPAMRQYLTLHDLEVIRNEMRARREQSGAPQPS